METSSHIEIAETFVRFYVLLSQHLDRCQDETVRQSLPEQDFQNHLANTRTKLFELVSGNRVVKDKVEKEYQRVYSVGTAFVYEGQTDQPTKRKLEQEREVLKIKTMALSDLVAVFVQLERQFVFGNAAFPSRGAICNDVNRAGEIDGK